MNDGAAPGVLVFAPPSAREAAATPGATVGPRLQAGDSLFAQCVVNETLRHLLLRANVVEIWRAAVGGGKSGEDRA